ncbi:MAG: anaerobic ribonucleoside-triphosphate reductase activating protein [Rikenellaceae bacterium]|jgi:anaerobic ribonucleoside-triphosphate reductase activating protein|nr:anaerobic ribonucleoside-triphosphate reductase activating protein [Rikenellaceae bacterium]
MLRLASYDVVFREIPSEVTLALNLSCCPNRCPGCHSPHLQEEVGELLDDGLFSWLLASYGDNATCVCFMGGDGEPEEVERLARIVHSRTVHSRGETGDRTRRQTRGGGLKTAWYSGRDALPDGVRAENFDYIKLGPWVEARGGLDSPTTNQRLFRVAEGELIDITEMLRK